MFYEKRDRIEELEKRNEDLWKLVRRAVDVLNVPLSYSSNPIIGFKNYLDRIEEEAEQKIERQKIEKIILDLKNRKWEPET